MIYVFLANGFEEIEALAPVDILRRADAKVITVGVGSKSIIGAHGITVQADYSTEELSGLQDCEAVILPGGMPGTLHLEQDATVRACVMEAAINGYLIGAICAAPSILGHLGLLQGKRAVCFPGFEEQLTGATVENTAVCVDDNIITACGAGAALKFGFAIVKALYGEKKSQKLESAMLCDR